MNDFRSCAQLTWRAANETRIMEKATKSSEEKSALAAKAKADRDAFYEQRKIKTEAAYRSNKYSP